MHWPRGEQFTLANVLEMVDEGLWHTKDVRQVRTASALGHLLAAVEAQLAQHVLHAVRVDQLGGVVHRPRMTA